jgi:hypothetical protein
MQTRPAKRSKPVVTQLHKLRIESVCHGSKHLDGILPRCCTPSLEGTRVPERHARGLLRSTKLHRDTTATGAPGLQGAGADAQLREACAKALTGAAHRQSDAVLSCCCLRRCGVCTVVTSSNQQLRPDTDGPLLQVSQMCSQYTRVGCAVPM